MNYSGYIIEIDTGQDGTFSHSLADVSNYVTRLQWGSGATIPYQQVAPSATLFVELNNDSGKFTLFEATAEYYGLITVNTLVRVRWLLNGSTETMSVLKVAQNGINVTAPSAKAGARITLQCTDWLDELWRFEVDPPLQQNVTTDQAIQTIFDKSPVIYPYGKAFFYIGVDSIGGSNYIYDGTLTNFDTGFTTLPYAGDNIGSNDKVTAQQLIREYCAAEFDSLFAWQPRSEEFVFFNRYHGTMVTLSPYVARTSSAYIMQADIEQKNVTYAQNMTNDIEVQYTPRKQGAAGSVIASSDNVPITFRAQQTRDFTMRYRDPDQTNTKTGALDIIQPQKGVDIIANSEADGSGDDWTEFLFVGYEIGAQSTKLTIYNRKVGDPAYITTLQIRGTPMTAYRAESVYARNDDSVYTNGEQKKFISNRAISDFDTAQNYADFMINKFGAATRAYQSITLVAAGRMASYVQTLTLGDRITIQDECGLDTDYMIVGEQHQVDPQTLLHRVTWILTETLRGEAFIIDESEIGSNDLIVL